MIPFFKPMRDQRWFQTHAQNARFGEREPGVAEETDFILPLLIANGITGIRDMGSELDAILHARTEIAAHRLLGPRMIVAGPMLDGPNAG
jgi:hypothetical protein